jgi:hypothetical protein
MRKFMELNNEAFEGVAKLNTKMIDIGGTSWK